MHRAVLINKGRQPLGLALELEHDARRSLERFRFRGQGAFARCAHRLDLALADLGGPLEALQIRRGLKRDLGPLNFKALFARQGPPAGDELPELLVRHPAPAQLIQADLAGQQLQAQCAPFHFAEARFNLFLATPPLRIDGQAGAHGGDAQQGIGVQRGQIERRDRLGQRQDLVRELVSGEGGSYRSYRLSEPDQPVGVVAQPAHELAQVVEQRHQIALEAGADLLTQVLKLTPECAELALGGPQNGCMRALDLGALAHDGVVADLLLLGFGEGPAQPELRGQRLALEVDEQAQAAQAARVAGLDRHDDGLERLAGGHILDGGVLGQLG